MLIFTPKKCTATGDTVIRSTFSANFFWKPAVFVGFQSNLESHTIFSKAWSYHIIIPSHELQPTAPYDPGGTSGGGTPYESDGDARRLA